MSSYGSDSVMYTVKAGFIFLVFYVAPNQLLLSAVEIQQIFGVDFSGSEIARRWRWILGFALAFYTLDKFYKQKFISINVQ